MYIVCQGRKHMFDFSKFIGIYIDEDMDKEYEIVSVMPDADRCLGIYKTEERAKEVLMDIAKKIEGKILVDFDGKAPLKVEDQIAEIYDKRLEKYNSIVTNPDIHITPLPMDSVVYYMPEK